MARRTTGMNTPPPCFTLTGSNSPISDAPPVDAHDSQPLPPIFDPITLTISTAASAALDVDYCLPPLAYSHSRINITPLTSTSSANYLPPDPFENNGRRGINQLPVYAGCHSATGVMWLLLNECETQGSVLMGPAWIQRMMDMAPPVNRNPNMLRVFAAVIQTLATIPGVRKQL